jgi:small-conductance mechanosensitive channel
MAQRSRKKRRSAAAPAAAPPAAGGEGGGYYARQRRRDEATRAGLAPLAPGERPGAVTVAAVVAAILCVVNLIAFAAGFDVSGEDPQPFGVLLFAVLMGVAAVAMWQRRYWAVLGFQALLAVSVLLAFISLLLASNLLAVLLTVTTMLACGTLFWFLVKAMARLQMPQRGTR